MTEAQQWCILEANQEAEFHVNAENEPDDSPMATEISPVQSMQTELNAATHNTNPTESLGSPSGLANNPDFNGESSPSSPSYSSSSMGSNQTGNIPAYDDTPIQGFPFCFKC
ncbi:hypothetical protein E3N88_29389 [Mikania micrantha]|uniref:Uncharacterized protein n=1 Tax=Mikania micrantha TaxID=192012 RepID=A0A5N6MJC0_9ASTR|nr:hypothetical protein E3N88_29389 [Mikania micrantha]